MTLTISLIIGYFVLIKVIAIYANRKSQKTTEDYYIVGRSISTFVLIGTLLATLVNGMIVTATPAMIIEGGVLALQFYITLTVFYTLMFVMGPRITQKGHEYGVMTQSELLFKHYNYKPLKWMASIAAILSLLPFLAVQMIAVGKVFASATNGVVSYELAIILLSASIGLYLLIGGSRAVVWTDVIQGFVFFIVLLITAVLFTRWTGGFMTGFEKLPEVIPDKLHFNEHNTPIFIDRALSWSFAFFFWPHVLQRCFMTRSPAVFKKSTLVTTVLGFCCLTMSLIIGVMATATIGEQVVDHDRMVTQMYMQFLPVGAAFVVITVFASGMSTIDSMMLSLSSIITRDTVRTRKDISELTKFRWAKAASILVVLGATLFVLSPFGRGMIAPLVTIGASFATLFLWPFIGMLYWKRASHISTTGAMIIGAATILAIQFTPLKDHLPLGSASFGFFAGLISFVGLTLAFPSKHCPLDAHVKA